jgi:hypothetical protein
LDTEVKDKLHSRAAHITMGEVVLLNGIMQLDTALIIGYRAGLPAPWTLLLSARPGVNPPHPNNTSYISFDNPDKQIGFWFTSGSLSYAIITNRVVHPESTTAFDLGTSLNHISLRYDGNKLTLFINSRQMQNDYVNLGKITNIRLGVKELGIVSLYTRALNKNEIAEHYVENHVKNFTDDEVLI